MHQMGEARLQASRAILSYVVPSASELIDQVREKVAAGGLAGLDSAAGGADIELLEVLGEGAFGKVYKALWRGTVCAVKSMMLPANMSGLEQRERMAFSECPLPPGKLTFTTLMSLFPSSLTFRPLLHLTEP